MSHIVQYSVDLRDYFYRKDDTDFFLAVDKRLNRFRVGESVVFWSSRKGFEGIAGYGVVTTSVIKPNELESKGAKLYNKNHHQIGVRALYQAFEEPYIPAALAYRLLSLSQHKQPVTISHKLNYLGFTILKELKVFLQEYHHIFCEMHDVDKCYFDFVTHLLRERYLILHNYKAYAEKLEDSGKICDFCKVDYSTNYGLNKSKRFLELHDTADPRRLELQKVDISQFKLICPNCHKTEHEKIRVLDKTFSIEK